MSKLKEKLNTKKDDDQLYGDLLPTKLRRLSRSSKLRAKHEIDNIMFKYMLQNEEDQQANVQAPARDQFTGPPPNPIDTRSGKQSCISSIVSINNCRINNRQYRQDNFQLSTVFKHDKKAM